MSRLAGFADEFVARGRLCTSLQVSYRTPSGGEDVAVGGVSDWFQVTVDTMFSVVCATKPILALGVALLAEHGLVDLSKPVSSLVTSDSIFRELHGDLWSVLNHSAGLKEPQLVSVLVAPEWARPELAASGLRALVPGYSEYLGQVVLAEVVQQASDESTWTFIQDRLLVALGIDDQIRFGFSPDELVEQADRIGVYVTGLPERLIPLLHDRSPHQACADRLTLGGYASAQGLCAMYGALGAVDRGEHVPGLPSQELVQELRHHPGEDRYEPDLNRACRFSGGFMIDLPAHGYGELLSAQSFGHTGYMGRSFGFYDPAIGLAGAAVVNGLDYDDRDLIEQLRIELVAAIIEAAS